MQELQIKLMYSEARNRLRDAEILSTNIKTKSDSGYLLELIAFEILLKAVALIHCNRYKRNHGYKCLYETFPERLQSKILEEANKWSDVFLTKERILELLEEYENNFIRLRYPFEAYKNMSETDYVEYGYFWEGLGAPENEAEFQYHPDELYGIIKALMLEVESNLSS